MWSVHTLKNAQVPCALIVQQPAHLMLLLACADGQMTVVYVLAATAISGIMQSVLGGQLLLIKGVAEPIVLIYYFMYEVRCCREGCLVVGGVAATGV